MPRPALTADQRKATRRRIRQAASELFSSKGVSEISARAIAEKAGVSTGTLYSYFDNLTELLQSLWKEPLVRLLNELEEIVAKTPEPRRRLRKLLEAYARFAVNNHSVYRSAFLYIRPESHAKPEPMDLSRDRLFAVLRDAVADGQKAGDFRKGNAGRIAQTLWAGLHGAIALPTNIDRLTIDPPERLLRHMIAMQMEWIEATD